MNEEVLVGGSINKVTKKGNIVFRDGGPWIPAVHKVLNHLNTNGFSYAPKPLGVDETGREMISFMPGESMMRPWRQPMFSDDGLVQSAKMLRALHDATLELEFPNDTQWRILKAGKTNKQIIRHGDLGPWNTLWTGDKLTGLIDWDLAEPGDAITDIAQMVAYFIPFMGGGGWQAVGFKDEPDYHHRLKVILDAYGDIYTEKDVILALDSLHNQEMARIIKFAAEGIYPWDKWLRDGEVEKSQVEQKWLHEKFPEYF